MIELKSSMIRQMELHNASEDVKSNGHYIPDQSLLERRDAMRETLGQPKRKRRIPWFTIITVATIIPFFMGGDSSDKLMSGLADSMMNPQMIQFLKDPDIINSLAGGNAKMSFSVGGKTFEKEITAQEIRAMQSKL